MNLKRGIIRVGVVLTGIYELYVLLYFVSSVISEGLSAGYLWILMFFLAVIVYPSIIWLGCWILFLVGRWIIKGFRGDKTTDTPAQE